MAINLRQEYDLVGTASNDTDTIFAADQGNVDNFKDFEMISWADSDYNSNTDGVVASNKTIDSNYVDLNSFGGTTEEMNIYDSVLGYFDQFTSTKDNLTLKKLNESSDGSDGSDVYEYDLAKINRDVDEINLYNDQILKENGNYWKINQGQPIKFNISNQLILKQEHASLKNVDQYLINIDANITYDNARIQASEA